jgi:hypothetical protein
MSQLDRQTGMMDGGANVARRYGAAINEWEAHSNNLQSKLRAATEQADNMAKQRLFAQAQLEGRTAVMQAMKNELARVCPNSPLLREDSTRKNIAGEAMAKFLLPHGYHYDKDSESVIKISP